MQQLDNAEEGQLPGHKYYLHVGMIGLLFFVFGFVTNINDILIPHFKKSLELTDFASAFVQSAFFGAYFIIALPSGWLLNKIGYKKGIQVGLVVCAAGAFIFLPAAKSMNYIVFLLGLSVLASGITLLQTAANPYASRLGPESLAASRINFMGVCNNIAGYSAPLIFGSLLLDADSNPEAFDKVAAIQKVNMPYLIMAIALLLFALLFRMSALPEISDSGNTSDSSGSMPNIAALWRFEQLRLGVVAIFLYVAAEVGIGSFIIRYGASLQIPGFTEKAAAHFVANYWLATGVGRLLGIFILRRNINSRIFLITNGLLAAALLLFTQISFGIIGLYAIVGIGLCNSIMWPVIFPTAIHKLGSYTKAGSSLLIMAIVGGAVFPPLMGAVSDAFGIKSAFLIVIPCYLYIAWYGIKMYKQGTHLSS
jgi:FHS family L-fucose permease-like MFS transporter